MTDDIDPLLYDKPVDLAAVQETEELLSSIKSYDGADPLLLMFRDYAQGLRPE